MFKQTGQRHGFSRSLHNKSNRMQRQRGLLIVPIPGKTKMQISLKKPKAHDKGRQKIWHSVFTTRFCESKSRPAKISSQSHLLRQNGALLSMAQRPTDMQTDVIIFMAGHCETRHAKQAGTTKRGCREHAQEDEHHDLADRNRKWQQILRLQLALA
jgi:hypothetical protein